jgi:hypothetical protein
MKTSPELVYNVGSRAWQDRCETRRLADRIEQMLLRTELGNDQRVFVERATMFFLASARRQPQDVGDRLTAWSRDRLQRRASGRLG